MSTAYTPREGNGLDVGRERLPEKPSSGHPAASERLMARQAKRGNHCLSTGPPFTAAGASGQQVTSLSVNFEDINQNVENSLAQGQGKAHFDPG